MSHEVNYLALNGGFKAIAVKYIECMEYLDGEEDKIIDKLKGDLTIRVTMISGEKHDISVKEQTESGEFKSYSNKSELFMVRREIIQGWKSLLKGNI